MIPHLGVLAEVGGFAQAVAGPANGYPDTVGFIDRLGVALICFILPALPSYIVYLPMHKLGRIKDGDMKLKK